LFSVLSLSLNKKYQFYCQCIFGDFFYNFYIQYLNSPVLAKITKEKKKRSKAERDSLVRERLAQRQAEEIEETSSTTTESSTGELDDKVSCRV